MIGFFLLFAYVFVTPIIAVLWISPVTMFAKLTASGIFVAISLFFLYKRAYLKQHVGQIIIATMQRTQAGDRVTILEIKERGEKIFYVYMDGEYTYLRGKWISFYLAWWDTILANPNDTGPTNSFRRIKEFSLIA
jgi:hypothetical protein